MEGGSRILLLSSVFILLLAFVISAVEIFDSAGCGAVVVQKENTTPRVEGVNETIIFDLIEIDDVEITFLAKVTAYCPCARCCGVDADGFTSKGIDANLPGVAVDPKRVPYGTVLDIPGYGIVIADDTGGAMRNSSVIHMDVRFPTHQEALNWGVKELTVSVRKKVCLDK